MPVKMQDSSGVYMLEWIADSGAGRNLSSTKSFVQQGIPVHVVENATQETTPLSFETGNGVTCSKSSVGIHGHDSGTSESYLLSNCPIVRSLGQIVENQAKPFLWIPGQLPCFLESVDHIQYAFDTSAAQIADRVDDFVPVFREQVQFVPATAGVPKDSAAAKSKEGVTVKFDTHMHGEEDKDFHPTGGAAGSKDGPDSVPRSDAPPEPALGSEPARPEPVSSPDPAGGEIVLAADSDLEAPPIGVEAHARMLSDAQSMEHKMLHMPKNPLCEICQRSRMYKRRTTSKRTDRLEERGALEEVTRFGERVSTDFIIVNKDAAAVQVVMDEFSLAIRTYITSRHADRVARNLLQFVGAAYHKNPMVLCKADGAPEIASACAQIGWAVEASLENRWPHNSCLERQIRTLQEVTRACHLQAGFHVIQDLWQHSVAYAAFVINTVPKAEDEVTRFEKATGKPYEGHKLLLGQLVHFRIHDPAMRHKFQASTAPGLFAGWRLEQGFVYKNVALVLQYDKLKERSLGYRDAIAVPTEEIYVPPGDPVLPLHTAAQEALTEFRDVKLADVTALDIPFSTVEPSTPIRKRAEYITLERVFKFGATPGCKGCSFEGTTHNPKCRARFDALIKADRIATATRKASPTTPSPAPGTPMPGTPIPEDPVPLPPPTAEEESVYHDTEGAEYVGSSEGEELDLSSVGTLPPEEIRKMKAMPGKSKDFLVLDRPFVEQSLALCRRRRLSSNEDMPGKGMLFEYACSEDSNIGVSCEQYGVQCIRLSKSLVDLSKPEDVQQVINQMLPGCDMWMSLPCTKFSPWQAMCVHLYGSQYQASLTAEQQAARYMLALAMQVLEYVSQQGGRIAIEWPASSGLWNLPEWIEFEQSMNLRRVRFNGCMFGLRGKQHLVSKPWYVSTNDQRLIELFKQYKCDKSHTHESVEGSVTQTTAFYPKSMTDLVVEAWYPQAYYNFIPDMSDRPYGLVTKSLSRSVWLNDERGVAAVMKEAEGLRANKTWLDETAAELSVLKARARSQGIRVKVADLLTLCGIKHHELSPELWKYKGRIVYRGDNIRDQNDQIILFDETSTTPTSLVALNLCLWFGCRAGCKTSGADAVQAFLQSDLDEGSFEETWVILPRELWLPNWEGRYHRVAVRLKKSLYGHPQAGRKWEEHLRQRLVSLGGVEMHNYPSNFVFRWGESQEVLVLNVYVDDLTLSGPRRLRTAFWAALRRKVTLEPETDVDAHGLRILGRTHSIQSLNAQTNMLFDMRPYVSQVVDLYCELSGTAREKLKSVPTPCHVESSMTDEELATQGSLHSCAVRILMKALWSARLSRPDICFAVTRLAARVTKWNRWEDRQLLRLVSYLKSTINLVLVGSVDHTATPELHVYTDADFASCPYTSKSTSGIFYVMQTGNCKFPILWSSKKQSSTARSTPEAEAIALASGVFGESLHAQEYMEHCMEKSVKITCQQDNETIIKIIQAGYSAKLRHAPRVHRVNIASLHDLLEEGAFDLVYCHTKCQLANGLTKVITPQEWPAMLDQMCMLSL